MSDRELLELAAKAAGLRLSWGDKYLVGGDEVDCTDIPYVVSDDRETAPAYWNPLEDDGDALRLAVDLHLALLFPMRGDQYPQVGAGQVGSMTAAKMESIEPNHYAATRRAIVRAAAAIAAGQAGESGK